LEPGTQNGVSLTLNPIDGTVGNIIIESIVVPTGTPVSLFEVDSAGNPIGEARASATVEDGEFVLSVPSGIVPDSRYVIQADVNGQIIETRYVNAGNIEISPVTHATSRLVSELASLTEGGLNEISLQEINEIQRIFQNIRNVFGPFAEETEYTFDNYIDDLIRILKSDIKTSAVATSAIASNQICGQVNDANGSPISGIRIVVRDFATFLLAARTTTDNNGNYCINVPATGEADPFTGFQPNDYIIGAINFTNTSTAGSGWWSSAGTRQLRIDAEKLVFSETSSLTRDIVLQSGARIQGSVIASGGDADGQPIPGIRVIARDATTQFPSASAIADANGSYQLNVAPGEYIIEAVNTTDQPYASETSNAANTPDGTNSRSLGDIFNLTAGSNTPVDFSLEPGARLDGIIENNNLPVVGQRIEINLSSGGASARIRNSLSNGRYQVWLRPDTYNVSAYGHNQTNLQLPDSLELLPLQFNSPVATIPLQINHQGSGVSKVKVRLYLYDVELMTHAFVHSYYSKSDGSATMYSTQFGTHRLVARVDSTQSYGSIVYDGQLQRQSGNTIDVDPSDNPVLAEVTINTPTAGVLTGVATSDGSTPLGNTRVVIRQGGSASANYFTNVRTRGDGRYTISLPPLPTSDGYAVRFNFADGSGVTCTGVGIEENTTTTLDVNASGESVCQLENPVLSETYNSTDLEGNWRLLYQSTPTKGSDAPEGYGVYSLTVTGSDFTSSCIYASEQPCGDNDPGTLSISNDGQVTFSPLFPDEQEYTWMSSGKDIMADFFINTTAQRQDFGVMIKQADSYDQSDLVGKWIGMGIKTLTSGFDIFSLDIDSIGNVVGTTIDCDNCNPETDTYNLSLTTDGTITESDANSLYHAVLSANKDVLVDVEYITDILYQMTISVKQAASYSMQDLVGTWTAVGLITPTGQGGDYGYDILSQLIIKSDGSGTAVCAYSSDLPCPSGPILAGTYYVDNNDPNLKIKINNQSKSYIAMNADKNVMVQYYQDPDPANPEHMIIIAVKRNSNTALSNPVTIGDVAFDVTYSADLSRHSLQLTFPENNIWPLTGYAGTNTQGSRAYAFRSSSVNNVPTIEMTEIQDGFFIESHSLALATNGAIYVLRSDYGGGDVSEWSQPPLFLPASLAVDTSWPTPDGSGTNVVLSTNTQTPFGHNNAILIQTDYNDGTLWETYVRDFDGILFESDIVVDISEDSYYRSDIPADVGG
jgi:hypothetical protein